ncbi:MAG: bifunctional 4-hydroxy-3-methylbut-2-enyl diphosphate reductase/30S ribosomal protein S1 [Clostridiales bacterium]|jgi:4-hydroxy-3-methylbut-2-enyl diphosphate reductase|nr:bifunctional 4-hydroxy-3-methylbut-2-enyl diphosphate reductase/30S ribosomal protein S1 [Clostridiales bacterium]
MKILLAKSAGFCFGVKRAVDMAYKIAENAGNKRVYTLGPLIHNSQVTARLREVGVSGIDRVADAPPDATVIIRTHGVAPEIYGELQARKIHYADATCPFVKKIHKIAREYHNKGYQMIIFGDESHPEVQGINGWCGYTAAIARTLTEFENLSLSGKACVVAQTTARKEIWEKIKKFTKTSCKEVLLFDTICSATDERQREAREIAARSDCMVVVGGRHSSNTKKLFDICKGCLAETYHIETASELPKSVFDRCVSGVTAGASTPEWIIKEVISIMSEETQVSELSFAEQLDKSLVNPKTGDIVKGTVIRVTPTEVYVDIGFKADGVIPLDQLVLAPDVAPGDVFAVGSEIEAFVYRVSDIEGTVGLSVRKLSAIAGKKKLEEALESREILTGKVVEAVNGGVIVLCNEIRVFVPASQASIRYLQDLSTLVGQEVNFRVIEINPRKRKIIGSIKSVAAEIKKQQTDAFWSAAEVGKEYDGVVKSLTDFGAFVDIGGVDGLVHISELSWGKIKHPSEVLNVGDSVGVYILALDQEKNKISLGYKLKGENPWIKARETFNQGDIVTAKIVRLVAFGAFAELLPSVDGLIHISQIAVERILKPSSVLSVGQEVQVKITAVDWENKKISLSIRALLEPEDAEVAAVEEPVAEETPAVEEPVAEEVPAVEEPVAEETPAVEEETTDGE